MDLRATDVTDSINLANNVDQWREQRRIHKCFGSGQQWNSSAGNLQWEEEQLAVAGSFLVLSYEQAGTTIERIADRSLRQSIGLCQDHDKKNDIDILVERF